MYLAMCSLPEAAGPSIVIIVFFQTILPPTLLNSSTKVGKLVFIEFESFILTAHNFDPNIENAIAIL